MGFYSPFRYSRPNKAKPALPPIGKARRAALQADRGNIPNRQNHREAKKVQGNY